jgi:hypothetical protein
MNLGTTNNQQPQPMYMVRAAKMEMADAAPAADYAGGTKSFECSGVG